MNTFNLGGFLSRQSESNNSHLSVVMIIFHAFQENDHYATGQRYTASFKANIFHRLFLFLSRWLQLPLYLGLVLAQCVYVYHFWIELSDLIGAVFSNQNALQHVLDMVAVKGAEKPIT